MKVNWCRRNDARHEIPSREEDRKRGRQEEGNDEIGFGGVIAEPTRRCIDTRAGPGLRSCDDSVDGSDLHGLTSLQLRQ